MKTAAKASFLSLNKNRKVKIFLMFLLLTSVIWLLVELSKVYTSTTTFKLQFTNVPIDKLLQNPPVSEVDLVLKAQGFSLLKYKFREHSLKFSLNNVAKSKQQYYILPNEQLTFLKEQLSTETEVLRVLADTIFVELGNNISKKVPVQIVADISFKLGYNFIESVKSEPDSITITGPEKYIDTIQTISTVPLKLNDVYENINSVLDLKLPEDNTLVKLSANKVKVTGGVDKFTEGIFNIPVHIINVPEGIKVNPFPKEISVIYQVGLSNFNKINRDSFVIVYDFDQYQNDSLVKYLTPVIIQQSNFIHAVKIVPNQLEFLIQK